MAHPKCISHKFEAVIAPEESDVNGQVIWRDFSSYWLATIRWTVEWRTVNSLHWERKQEKEEQILKRGRKPTDRQFLRLTKFNIQISISRTPIHKNDILSHVATVTPIPTVKTHACSKRNCLWSLWFIIESRAGQTLRLLEVSAWLCCPVHKSVFCTIYLPRLDIYFAKFWEIFPGWFPRT